MHIHIVTLYIGKTIYLHKLSHMYALFINFFCYLCLEISICEGF